MENGGGGGATQGGPNTVLRVIIEQMLYPVTLDVLYQIFSRVGKVLRIVTFTKNNYFQALIQYPDVVMAQAAKLVRLKINFVKFTHVFAKFTLFLRRLHGNLWSLQVWFGKFSVKKFLRSFQKNAKFTNFIYEVYEKIESLQFVCKVYIFFYATFKKIARFTFLRRLHGKLWRLQFCWKVCEKLRGLQKSCEVYKKVARFTQKIILQGLQNLLQSLYFLLFKISQKNAKFPKKATNFTQKLRSLRKKLQSLHKIADP